MESSEPIGTQKYKLKDSVDVYLINNSDGFRIQFYKINTREKVTIETDERVSHILSLLDGVSTNNEVLSKLDFDFDQAEFFNLLQFLIDNGIVQKELPECSEDELIRLERYSRQIHYFDDLLNTTPGLVSQNALNSSHVAIFGAGSVGGAIAIELVRAGVGEITIFDYKIINKAHKQRHFYYKSNYIGLPKVHALKDYLLKINKNCKINSIVERLSPNSDLEELLPQPLNLVVNTADEPYIGHTTIKLGRELWGQEISMYVAGGFDAHLMSTGEFIIPNQTPCVDCYSKFFKLALSDWKPQYAPAVSVINKTELPKENNPPGGAAGIGAQSLFSASFGSINIINYLLKNDPGLKRKSNRGEYLVNKSTMTWFDLEGASDCDVCGK